VPEAGIIFGFRLFRSNHDCTLLFKSLKRFACIPGYKILILICNEYLEMKPLADILNLGIPKPGMT
jgi:hypothetical protein